jgi:hypothetical protein
MGFRSNRPLIPMISDTLGAKRLFIAFLLINPLGGIDFSKMLNKFNTKL